MPNWAYTSYYLRSSDDSAKELYNKMLKLQNMTEPLKPNGFGTTWLGNLVEDLGVNYDKVYCRGSWDDLRLEDGVLHFTTETAWNRCSEVENLIKEKYPEMEIHFFCEECGMGIYVKNSTEFFPEDYIVDIDNDEIEYLSEDETLSHLSDFFGIDFNTIDDLLLAVNEHNDKEENEDNQIRLNKIELVD